MRRRAAKFAWLYLMAVTTTCAGQCIPSVEGTVWGGNEWVVIQESKVVSTVNGIVVTDLESLEPWSNVLVEVFDHPEVRLKSGPSDRKSQKRITGCKTDGTGLFSFTLPPGKYELRLSYSNANVTSLLVKVSHSLVASKRRLVVNLSPGT